MKNIVIIGAGGFGKEVKFLIDRINAKELKFNIIGYYDDNTNQPEAIFGIPYLGKVENLLNETQNISVALGIGVPNIKRQIINRFDGYSNFNFPSLVDPGAIVGSDNVSIGKGSIICAGSIITCNVEIADFVTLNLSCTVGHDTILGAYSSFMPSVNISGEVIIEKEVYVGTGSKIINQLEIGESSIIGAGAVVAKSIPKHCTAVGIPAKPIKFRDEKK